jgi:CRISPR-associated protein Cas1
MAFDAGVEAEPGWSSRNDYWLQQSQSTTIRRNKRARRSEPLILSGHGVNLRIERGVLHIRNGFTHYPQERETFHFFKGDLNLPPRIIMLDGSGGVSFDVLAWLSEQNTALIQLDWRGQPVMVIGGSGYCADPSKVAWQTTTRDDPVKRLAFSTGIIRDKIEACIATLGGAVPSSTVQAAAIARLEVELRILRDSSPFDVAALRGVEGRASKSYFTAWRGLELKFKPSRRYPIPDDWRTIGSRAAVRAGMKPKNVNANHPFNAMLNYAYAALQTRLQIETVAAGYDPTIGVMHHAQRRAPAYVFDLMEPERPKVDAALLSFVQAETFSGADFVITNDGTCRLGPQLANLAATLY